MSTGTFSGLALWLVPSQGTKPTTQLKLLLDELAQRYSTPHFSPHVTLLSGIPSEVSVQQLSERVHNIAQGTRPFQVQYNGVGTHGTYFQYVFAKVAPSEALSNLRHRVRQAVMPSESPDDYFPHLSLVYGEDAEHRSARDIVAGLENSGDERLVGFEVTSIQIVRCEGRPEDWQVLEDVTLIRV